MALIFRHVAFLITLAFFLIVPMGCCKNIESHVMSNDQWIQEQVEKGNLTPEEAENYKKEIKVIHNH